MHSGRGGGWELRELRRVELPADDLPARRRSAARCASRRLFGERLAQLLGGLSAPVREASLVLPDAWLRLTFVESGELPRAAEARDEVVRWKVKRLLPFRVEDLRLAASEVAPLPQQSEPQAAARRLRARGAARASSRRRSPSAGVWLGRITSESLALLPAVGEALAEAPLGALAVVRDGGYTLLFTRRGEPVLYRFKSLDETPSAAARSGASSQPGALSTVERDLRLTRAFVAEQLPDLAIARVVVAAGDGNRDEARAWQDWLAAGLGRAGEPLESLRLPLASAERVGWMEVAPMLGAARAGGRLNPAVNLASRPFANTRPLRRVAVALWVLGVVLAALAGTLYWRSLFGIEGGREKIAAVDRSHRRGAAPPRRRRGGARRPRPAAAERRGGLPRRPLRERTFPWSALFEHLAQVLPRKVRLISLSPHVGSSREDRGARRRAEALLRSGRPAALAYGGRVYLQMAGVAADDEALTSFLDRLFASEWFANPSLPGERRQDGQIRFALSVTYLPAGRAGAAAAAAAARERPPSPARAATRPPPAPAPTRRSSAGDEL